MDLTVGDHATANLSGEDVISTKYEDVKKIDREFEETFIGIKGEGHSSVLDATNKYVNLINDDYEGKEINAARTTGQVIGDVSNLVFNDTAGGSTSVGWSQDKENFSSTERSENINTITGGKINISSKKDTTLKGVDIAAQEVTVDAGGTLALLLLKAITVNPPQQCRITPVFQLALALVWPAVGQVFL